MLPRARSPTASGVGERDLARLVDERAGRTRSRCSSRANSHAVPATSLMLAVDTLVSPRRARSSTCDSVAAVALVDARGTSTPSRRGAASTSASRLWIAAWLGAVTPTRLPARRARRRSSARRGRSCPVPGGPWTAATSPVERRRRARPGRRVVALRRGGSRRSSARGAASKRPSPASIDAAERAAARRAAASAPIGLHVDQRASAAASGSPARAEQHDAVRRRSSTAVVPLAGGRVLDLPLAELGTPAAGSAASTRSDSLHRQRPTARSSVEHADRVALVDELLGRLAAQVEVAPPRPACPRGGGRAAGSASSVRARRRALPQRGAISASTSGSHAGGVLGSSGSRLAPARGSRRRTAPPPRSHRVPAASRAAPASSGSRPRCRRRSPRAASASPLSSQCS